MSRIVLALILIFLIFLIQGLLLSLRPELNIRYRLFGAIYLCVCLLIIVKGNIRVGIQSVCDPKDNSLTTQSGITAPDLNKTVRDIVEPIFYSMGQVGLVVVTRAGEQEDITSFGRTAIYADQSPKNDTLFEIGSTSKLFTASLLAAAVEQKQLSLNTRIADLLSLPENSSEQKKKLTLEHLVTHSAGLPRMSADIFYPWVLAGTLFGQSPYTLYTIPKVKKIFWGSKIKQSSSGQIKYSNIGFGLLGVLLSEQFHTPYDQLIKKVIADPLGMADTCCCPNAYQQARCAQGYTGYYQAGSVYLVQKAKPSAFAQGLVGAGGLYSTGRDMLCFLRANMVQPANSLSFLESTHHVIFHDGNKSVGMGWFTIKLPDSEEVILFHNGLTGGFACFIGISMTHQVGLVMLGNVSRSMDEHGVAIMKKLIETHQKNNPLTK